MPRPPRIPSDVWESYQEILRQWYLAQDKSLPTIITEMQTEYGFNASKNEYQRIFDAWGFRKTLKEDDWRFIDRRKRKREREDSSKETAVYLNDTRVNPKRVKNELRRRCPPTMAQKYLMAAPSPNTPPGIIVRTPRTPHSLGTPGTPNTPKTPGNAGNAGVPRAIRLNNLPQFMFESILNSNAQVGLTDDWVSSMMQHLESPRSPQPRAIGYPGSGNSQLPGVFINQTDTNTVAAKNMPALISMSDLFKILVPDLLPESEEYLPRVHSSLQAGFIELYEGDLNSCLQVLQGPFSRDSFVEFVKCAALLSSNNKLSSTQIQKFLDWVVATNNELKLQTMLSTGSLTLQAFGRDLWECALRGKNDYLVEILVKAGIDINAPTKGGLTPVQIVATTGRYSVMNFLLASGANVNGYINLSQSTNTSLMYAVRAGDIEMFDILLENGADINFTPLRSRSILALAIEGFFRGTLEFFFIKRLLQMGVSADSQTLSGGTRTPLQSASEIGDVELVELLLKNGAEVNASPALVSGVPQKSSPILPTVLQQVIFDFYDFGDILDVVNLLLEFGANVNAPALSSPEIFWDDQESREDDLHGITALQGAVRGYRTDGGCYLSVTRIIITLLESGALVNAPPGVGGMTALQYAVLNSDSIATSVLLEWGADPNTPVKSTFGDNIVELAVASALEKEDDDVGLQIVSNLLDAGTDVTQLVIGAKWLPEDIYDILQNAGAKIDPFVELFQLIEESDIEGVVSLLKSGIDCNQLNSDGKSALGTAINYCDEAMLLALLDYGADPNVTSNSATELPESIALRRAVRAKSAAVVSILIDYGLKINIKCPSLDDSGLGWTTNILPELALDKGNFQIIQVLLDAGADVNASAIFEHADKTTIYDLGITALLSAIHKANLPLVEELLRYGADVNHRPKPHGGPTPLQAAAMKGNASIFTKILQAGADVNAPAHGNDGKTALQAAVSKENFTFVQMLLGAGADPNTPACDSHGLTALQAAVSKGNLKLVQNLLAAGADPNGAPSEWYGFTALQGAAARGDLGIAAVLLEAGADPNAPAARIEGKLALEAAAGNGRLDMVQLLLNADVDIGGMHAVRARDLASKKGHAVVAKLLDKFC